MKSDRIVGYAMYYCIISTMRRLRINTLRRNSKEAKSISPYIAKKYQAKLKATGDKRIQVATVTSPWLFATFLNRAELFISYIRSPIYFSQTDVLWCEKETSSRHWACCWITAIWQARRGIRPRYYISRKIPRNIGATMCNLQYTKYVKIASSDSLETATHKETLPFHQ